ALIRSRVDYLFSEAQRRHPRALQNPVTGEYWLSNVVPEEPEKRNACRALLARECFAVYGPADGPPLPLSDVEIETMSYQGDFANAVARFASSLRANDWDIKKHPSFEEYVGGLL